MPDIIRFSIAGMVAPFQKKVMTWNAKDGRSGTLAYNSGTYSKWKPYARLAAADAMKDKAVIDGPVSVIINMYYPVPASASNRFRTEALAGIVRPTKTPDVDNVMKAVADSCLTGVVIRDDKFIVNATLMKWYSDKPRVDIEVTPWSPISEGGLFQHDPT